MVEGQHKLIVAGQEVFLLPQRALYWPKEKILAVSDLHWGKTETFQQFGVRIPNGVLNSDLARLGEAIVQTRPNKLVVLGDMIHHRSGVDQNVVATILNWRKLFRLPIELIEGNHDRGISQFLELWNIQASLKVMVNSPFIFSHDQLKNIPTDHFCWSGHLHPVVRMRGRGDSLRAPCFYLTSQGGVLPAFSSFTGGQEVKKENQARIFSVLEDRNQRGVFEL